MSGNIGDVGSIPESVVSEIVQRVLEQHHYGPCPVSLTECRRLVGEVDRSFIKDFTEGEIDGIAEIVLHRINDLRD